MAPLLALRHLVAMRHADVTDRQSSKWALADSTSSMSLFQIADDKIINSLADF